MATTSPIRIENRRTELAELMREAFGSVAAANEGALAAMGERIERESERVLASSATRTRVRAR